MSPALHDGIETDGQAFLYIEVFYTLDHFSSRHLVRTSRSYF